MTTLSVLTKKSQTKEDDDDEAVGLFRERGDTYIG